MKRSLRSVVITSCVAAGAIAACAAPVTDEVPGGSGATSGVSGAGLTGGMGSTGGSAGAGGTGGTGGAAAGTGGVTGGTGGVTAGTGGATGGTGGVTGGTGGVTSGTGGVAAGAGGATGGAGGAAGGMGGAAAGTGGAGGATGGMGGATAGKGGAGGVGGAVAGRGGTAGTASGAGGMAAGGGAAGTGGGSEVNCSTPMPSGGTAHCGSNTQGNAGGQAWSLWSNAVNSNSCITTFNAPAFSASWNNSGDFLARLGVEWQSPQPYETYGSIIAQFSYTKTGSGGGFSYIGIYGWTNNPCVEYYIIEDSFNNFPFNAYNATQKGSAVIDGETYKLFQNSTTGTGGSRCSGVSSWSQYWSIRQSARQCGTVTINQHFDAWTAAGMPLGNMLEAKILVEVGGGSGSVQFPVASVTAE